MITEKDLRSAFVNSFIYKAISFSVLFFSSVMVFRYFSPELRGEIAILLAPILLIQIGLFDSGVKVLDLISKDLKLNQKNNFTSVWSSYYLKFFSALIFASLLYFFGPKIAEFYGLVSRKEIYTLCSILLILNFLNGPLDINVLQATNKFKELRIYGIIESFVPFLSITMTILWKGTLEMYIYLYIASKLILLPYSWYLILKSPFLKYFAKVKYKEIFNLFSFSAPLWIASFIAFGSSQYVPLISGLFFDLEIVGIMSLALGLTFMVISIISALDSFSLSKANENSRVSFNVKRSKINYLLKYWEILFFLSSLLSLVVFLLSNLLVSIIGGVEYSKASEILRWLCILISLKPLGVLRIVIYMSETTKKIALYSFYKLILEASFIICFFYFFGPPGVAFGLALAFLYYGFLLANFTIKQDNLFKSIIYNIFKNHLIVASVLFLINLLTLVSFSGYIFCVVFLIYLIFNLNAKKEKFLRILKT